MGIIYTIHAVFGERVLPLLIVLVAVYLTITWRPDARPGLVARLFAVLVDIQVALGLIYFIYGIVAGAAANYLSFPFLLHPILGLVAAGVAHLAIRPGGLARGLGRWSALAALVVLLVIVIANVWLAGLA
jgi:hypothetical protein